MPAHALLLPNKSSGIQTPRRKAKPWRPSMRIVGLLAATPIEPRTRPPRWDPRSHRSNLLRATQCAQLSRAVSGDPSSASALGFPIPRRSNRTAPSPHSVYLPTGAAGSNKHSRREREMVANPWQPEPKMSRDIDTFGLTGSC
ncbi:hypothetical protein Cob_v005578 [Colletotrichum orbiculare MAFF 240422]|uniref:Uncharacterized protein n=1 Tax=Colletotrichum orbiculare (strain 104-T / ATCC 96160 / CBS 514.97 / LARS 414 / MAFF 240422) TaxID=1213857 RepID=A0A484FU83_COLOR|nr:hypothetical protein Cob_v005578 [Colletotrichum orbiculare MAFF 240422]